MSEAEGAAAEEGVRLYREGLPLSEAAATVGLSYRYAGRGRDRVLEVGPEGFVIARRDTITLRPVSWDF